MDIYLGTVSEVIDTDKFVIKFTIREVVEDAKAYPVDTFDEPNIGDPIVVYQLESVFGYCYLYKKLRVADYTRMKLGNSEIDLTNESISITTKNGATVTVSSDGAIQIYSAGSIDIQSDTKISLDAPQIESSGSVVSGAPGPFCAIQVCPYSGQPHTGNIVSK